jgi:predicted DNA-binding protein (UPF0251 family)
VYIHTYIHTYIYVHTHTNPYINAHAHADTVVTALEELSALRRADIMHVCDQERALDMMRSVQLMVTLKEEAAVSEARLANINTRFQVA